VELMGREVFSGCSNLKNIYCESESKPSSSDVWEWDNDWLGYCSATVHWGNEWEYVNGVPTLK
jgi:hypothetical protein